MANRDELEKLRNTPPSGEFASGKELTWEEYEALLQVDETAEKHMREQRLGLIRDAQATGKVTEEYAHLLRYIDSETGGSRENASFFKVSAAVALHKELGLEGLGTGRVAVIGSGVDWQFPVALGARMLDMVDPFFTNQQAVMQVVNTVASVDAEFCARRGTYPELEFGIDLGRGAEPIQLRLIGQDARTYQPAEELAGIVQIMAMVQPPASGPVLPHIAPYLRRGAHVANFDFPRERYQSGQGYEEVESEGFLIYRVTDVARATAWAQERAEDEQSALSRLRRMLKRKSTR